jgi:hypothetical protein
MLNIYVSGRALKQQRITLKFQIQPPSLGERINRVARGFRNVHFNPGSFVSLTDFFAVVVAAGTAVLFRLHRLTMEYLNVKENKFSVRF